MEFTFKNTIEFKDDRHRVVENEETQARFGEAAIKLHENTDLKLWKTVIALYR